jgi:hypothetical protein
MKSLGIDYLIAQEGVLLGTFLREQGIDLENISGILGSNYFNRFMSRLVVMDLILGGARGSTIACDERVSLCVDARVQQYNIQGILSEAGSAYIINNNGKDINDYLSALGLYADNKLRFGESSALSIGTIGKEEGVKL